MSSASVQSALETERTPLLVRSWVACLAALLLSLTPLARAQSKQTPLEQIAHIDQRLDSQVPLDLTFLDEAGDKVQLSRYFGGKKPVVLALVYYECPMLCTLVLNGMETSFQKIPLKVGPDFEVVNVSINPRETPVLAARKKKTYIDRFNQPGSAEGWHFLTQSPDSPGAIRQLADSVGFHYAYDEKTQQYIHAAGIMVLTPGGRTSRYFYGIDFAPMDLRLGLVDASGGKIGSPVDQLLLLCCQYDPKTAKYGVVVMNVLRLAGGVMLLIVGAVVGGFVWRERRKGRTL